MPAPTREVKRAKLFTISANSCSLLTRMDYEVSRDFQDIICGFFTYENRRAGGIGLFGQIC